MENKPFIDFQGKKVIVTGASSGIGRAISVELSRYGAIVILLGRDMERLDETASLIESEDSHTMVLDLREHSAILSKIKEFSREFGRIYGLCHCAGVVETRPLSSIKVDGLKSMIDVNLVSGIELARSVCRRDVMEKKGGSILFISSIYALVGMPGQIGYSASKGAVNSAVRTMAIELARRKIRTNTLSPGLVRTDMTNEAFKLLTEEQVKKLEQSFPLGVGNSEDVARAAAFLLAPQNTWITGIDLVVDGGYTAR